MTAGAATLRGAKAQDALRDVVGQLTRTLRNLNGKAPALGEWTLAEVALHLSQVWVVVPALARGDLKRVRELAPGLVGGAGELLIRDIWDLGGVTLAGVASDPERDPGVLADRIEERAEEFFAESRGKSPDEPRPWIVEGVVVPRSMLTAHLLSETAIHGYDIARAARLPWKIEPSWAALVFEGFIVEAIRALDPAAMVDQKAATGVRATYEIRLRHDGRFAFVFEAGKLRVETERRGRVDCHISADPWALLLVGWGRQSQWRAIARGQLVAWGRKPWLGPRLPLLLRHP